MITRLPACNLIPWPPFFSIYNTFRFPKNVVYVSSMTAAFREQKECVTERKSGGPRYVATKVPGTFVTFER